MKIDKRCILLSLLVGVIFAFCFVIGENIETVGYLTLSDKTIFLKFFGKSLLFSCIIFFLWSFGGTLISKRKALVLSSFLRLWAP